MSRLAQRRLASPEVVGAELGRRDPPRGLRAEDALVARCLRTLACVVSAERPLGCRGEEPAGEGCGISDTCQI